MRLAHRVKELHELPHGLAEMPSIVKVKNWYAQSFEELVEFPPPRLPEVIQKRLAKISMTAKSENTVEVTPNPSLLDNARLEDGVSKSHLDASGQANANRATTNKRWPMLSARYLDELNKLEWPAEVQDYNERFTQCLERIKRRHDATVTTVAQGVLEYKRAKRNSSTKADVQLFLDRFYMSRIGIRFLIGQHIALARSSVAAQSSRLGRLTGVAEKPPSAALEGLANAQDEEEFVGVICTNTNVGSVAHEAIENARFVCEEHYGLFKGPPVQLVCPKNLTFMYVPSHLNVRTRA